MFGIKTRSYKRSAVSLLAAVVAVALALIGTGAAGRRYAYAVDADYAYGNYFTAEGGTYNAVKVAGGQFTSDNGGINVSVIPASGNSEVKLTLNTVYKGDVLSSFLGGNSNGGIHLGNFMWKSATETATDLRGFAVTLTDIADTTNQFTTIITQYIYDDYPGEVQSAFSAITYAYTDELELVPEFSGGEAIGYLTKLKGTDQYTVGPRRNSNNTSDFSEQESYTKRGGGDRFNPEIHSNESEIPGGINTVGWKGFKFGDEKFSIAATADLDDNIPYEAALKARYYAGAGHTAPAQTDLFKAGQAYTLSIKLFTDTENPAADDTLGFHWGKYGYCTVWGLFENGIFVR
jgi:hypothetical protein